MATHFILPPPADDANEAEGDATQPDLHPPPYCGRDITETAVEKVRPAGRARSERMRAAVDSMMAALYGRVRR